MNIRLKTCLIIRKDNKYLIGLSPVTKALNWSESYFSAWRTRDIQAAKAVSRITGGELMLFNPVTGELKGV